MAPEDLTDFLEAVAFFENLCTEMYKDLNDGRPSMALRYTLFKLFQEDLKAEPMFDDFVLDRAMELYVDNVIEECEKHIVKTVINLN